MKMLKILTMDEALVAVGSFGIFQKTVEAILCFTMFFEVFQPYIMYFAILQSPWKCVKNSTICLKEGILQSEDFSRCYIPRDQWYFTEHKGFSLVTWFDIPCEEHWMLGATGTVFFVGVAVGSVVLGWISDKKGRKPVLVTSTAMLLFFGLLTSFAPNMYWILCFRFLVGFFQPGVIVLMAVIMTEIVGPKHRNIASLGPSVVAPIAWSLMPIKAYLLKDWRMLCIVSTAPYFVVVAMYWFVPESVKWLHETGKDEEAMDVLKRIARCNKTDLPGDFNLAPPSNSEMASSGSNVGLSIITSSLIQALIWSSGVASFYGFLYVVHKLPGNLYLNSFLLNIFEFPTAIIAIACCNRYGRKRTNLLPLFLSGICSVIIAAIPSGSIIKVIVAVAAKFLVIITFESIYLWSAELYQTCVRSTALGILEFASRVSTGGIMFLAASAAPSWVIFVVLGASSIVAASFGMLLPETNPNIVKRKEVDSYITIGGKSRFNELKRVYNYLVRFRIQQMKQARTEK